MVRDKCGVVGIYLQNSKKATTLTYYALYALQHRGQESAGIAVVDSKDSKIKVKKGMGLVSDVFTQDGLKTLNGSLCLGHARYATRGERSIENAQPMISKSRLGSVALCHNGQLVNYKKIQAELEEAGDSFSSTSDTEIILKLIAKSYKEGIIEAVINALSTVKGSYALCIMTKDCLIGVRDPYGIRPLILGELTEEGGGYIIASESCAIDSVKGRVIRDIKNGEMVVINKEGFTSIDLNKRLGLTVKKQPCIFEYVYFARPDSVIDGIPVEEARQKMGEVLAEENKIKADVVVGVPDSGIGAAIGFAKKSGIPYAMGIVKNKYIGRSFIAPTQEERVNMVSVKLNAIGSVLKGKSVIVIDDSIVRGTTSKLLIQMIRRAGAKEVHFLVSSPPVKFPCYLGIDTPTKTELISGMHDIEEIRQEIGADSLSFITLSGMIRALLSCNKEVESFCKGCFLGEYPVENND